MVIRRGTTPYITAEILDEVDISNITQVWLYFTQNIGDGRTIIIDKDINDVTVNGNKIHIRLTQEETLSFVAGVITNIQIRLLNDGEIAYASNDEFVTIEEVYKGGVIK